MLSHETQEAIVAKAFFEELSKQAGVGTKIRMMLNRWSPEAAMGRAAGKAVADQRVLGLEAAKIQAQMDANSAVVEATTNAFGNVAKDMPTSANKAEKLRKAKSRTLLGAAAALGLGASGYGYYQYKRDKINGQLAGAYPQVS